MREVFSVSGVTAVLISPKLGGIQPPPTRFFARGLTVGHIRVLIEVLLVNSSSFFSNLLARVARSMVSANQR